jgi:hypothetical protein
VSMPQAIIVASFVSVRMSKDERNDMAWVNHWPYNAGRGSVATVSREGARPQVLPARMRVDAPVLCPSSMARPVTTRLATPAPQTPIEPATHPDLHAMDSTSPSEDNGDAITSVP